MGLFKDQKKRFDQMANIGTEMARYGRVLTPDERADVSQIMAIPDEELRRKTLALFDSDLLHFGRVATPAERKALKRLLEEREDANKKQEDDDIRTFGRVLNDDEREQMTRELQAKKRIESLIADAEQGE